MLGAGSFFSVNTLVGLPPSTPLSHAVGTTWLAELSQGRTQALLHDDVAFHAHVGRLVAVRLGATTSMLADVAGSPLPRSLARRLAAQMLAAGQAPFGSAIELPMSQKMLSEILGASRSRVNEELALMESIGMLRRAYRRIIVLDPVRLLHAAGSGTAPL